MESEKEELQLSVWLRDRLRFIEGMGEYATLFGNVLKAAIKKPPALYLLLKQLYDVGVSSLPVVAITGLFTGLVLAAQSFYQLADKGLTTLTGLLVAKAMT